MLEKTAEQVATPTLPKFPRQGEWTYEDWLKFPDDGWKYEIIFKRIAPCSSNRLC